VATPCREQAGATEQKYFDAAMVLACLGFGAAALYAML
jgi:hypothetical protein